MLGGVYVHYVGVHLHLVRARCSCVVNCVIHEQDKTKGSE